MTRTDRIYRLVIWILGSPRRGRIKDISRKGRLTGWDVVFLESCHVLAPKAPAFHSLGYIDGRPNKFIIRVMGSPRERRWGAESKDGRAV